MFEAIRNGDIVAVRALLADGVNPRLGDGRETTLHAAARVGSSAIVEALVEGGALEWLTDDDGRFPADVARECDTPDRDAIVALLDRSLIADPSFRAAVDAIASGDLAALEALLDTDDRLLRERIRGPEAYRRARRAQYFLDPKLFWFVANNPTRVRKMPANIVEIARAMIARGIAQADLDYTLELVMTNADARKQGRQRPLMDALLAAGAKPSRETVLVAAGHGECDALRALLECGEPMTAAMAAALGENDRLREFLASADTADRQDAFGVAVINGNVAAARMALDAGADVNAFLPVHAHGTALHSAAIGRSVALLNLLLESGARRDARDTLWDATPLEWAIHEDVPKMRARLEAAAAADR